MTGVVPAELVHFFVDDWSGDPFDDEFEEHRITRCSGGDDSRREQRALQRWARARTAWAAEHGWPTGDLEQILEVAAEKLRPRRAGGAR